MEKESSSKHLQNTNVPRLRFSGFEGEWETLKLSDVFSEIVDKKHSELPVLSIQQGIGTVLRDTSERRISYDKNSLENYKAIQPGDFIIHLRSFEGGLECSNHFGITSPAYKILRTSKLLPIAFKDYFRSYKFIEGKLSIAVTGIRDGKNIDMPSFWEIEINIPGKREQQKIATFLSLIDERISKQRDLVEKLKTYKRGLIRDFLSNNCSYELRTLESLFEIKAGGDISKENCQTNQSPHFPYPVYANSLTNKGLYGYANYYKICGDTITVTGRGEIGHATARHENYVPIVRLLSLIPKTELDVDFFAEIINETNIFVESTGVPQLTSPQLGKVQVPWIEPSVQKNCAQIIKTIDNLVTKQQEIYNNLLLYKNGLLQQMFI